MNPLSGPSGLPDPSHMTNGELHQHLQDLRDRLAFLGRLALQSTEAHREAAPLHHRVAQVERTVVDRLLRTEQTAISRLQEESRRPGSGTFGAGNRNRLNLMRDLPSNVIHHHLLPFVADVDLVTLAACSSTEVAGAAQATIESAVAALERFCEIDPLFRGVWDQAIRDHGNDADPGKLYLSWIDLLARELRNRRHPQHGLHARGLIQRIRQDLHAAKDRHQIRVLLLLKSTLATGLGRLAPGLIRDLELSDDFDIAAEAVRQTGRALQLASERLRDHPAIVIAAVQQHGKAFQYASDRLRDNRRIALAAVKKDGRALQFASERLRDDSALVLAALQQSGLSFIYASGRLKNDPTALLAAMERINRRFLEDLASVD
jgi:hypothetical protein